MRITNEQIYDKLSKLEQTTAMLVERSGGCSAKHSAVKDEIKVWFFYSGVLGGLLGSIIMVIGWFLK